MKTNIKITKEPLNWSLRSSNHSA